MSGSRRTSTFQVGDLALLVDRKGRRYLLTLSEAGVFHSHVGALPHSLIIGQTDGCRVTVSGQRLLVLKPTLAEYIQEVPRATQIVYPKDIGAILTYGDIFPGARVLEGGLGSGALTLALLRAAGEAGTVVSYEQRPDRVEPALRNIRRVLPDPSNLEVRVADIYQGVQERELDRVVLDLPEPWRLVPTIAEALAPGGILLSYLPTVLQVHRLVMALQQHPQFDQVESFEVLLRPWHVASRSVRPVHRMVAHTAFITTARRCSPGKLLPLEEVEEIGSPDRSGLPGISRDES